MVWAVRILSLAHFVLAGVALGLVNFSDYSTVGVAPVKIAGNIGAWVAQLLAFLTPAYMLAANAGNAGYTALFKALTFIFLLIVELSIFLTFWVGYSSVLWNPAVSESWVSAQIAAIVFISLDFIVVAILAIMSLCTETAAHLEPRRRISGIALIALLVQILCIGIILGISYIWIGIIEATVPGYSTTAPPATSSSLLSTSIAPTQMTTTAINGTTLSSTTVTSTLTSTSTTSMAPTSPPPLPELVLTNVGQFLSFGLYTFSGCVLVIRSREGGMLSQDIIWSVVSIIAQSFNLIMKVFIELGSQVALYSTAAIAVSIGAFYALDLILLFVLTFKQRAVESPWDLDNNNAGYGRLRY